MSINNRELFSEWLNCKSINKPPINLILLAFDEVSEFAISRKLSKVGIWSISSQSDFKFVRVAVSKNQILRVVHNEAHKAVDDKEIVAEASLKIAEDNYSVVATDVHVEKHSNVNVLPFDRSPMITLYCALCCRIRVSRYGFLSPPVSCCFDFAISIPP